MRLLASITTTLAVAAGAWAAPQQYFLTDLGDFTTTSISSDGTVVSGYKLLSPGSNTPLAWINGALVDLGHLGGGSGEAFATNGTTVVGQSRTGGGQTHAFAWTQVGGMIDLGTLGGTTSLANDVNVGGLVVGVSSISATQTHSFYWQEGMGMVDIGGLGGDISVANAVDSAGSIVGTAQNTGGTYHAFRWSESTGMVSLFTDADHANALDINEAGFIVGTYDPGGFPTDSFGFLWSQSTGRVTINGFSTARALNSQKYVIGTTKANGSAGIWYGQGAVHDLNDLLDSTGDGWNIRHVSDINDAGQIVGWGVFNGEDHAVLLTPVPEPATFAALGLGLALFARRRKRTV